MWLSKHKAVKMSHDLISLLSFYDINFGAMEVAGACVHRSISVWSRQQWSVSQGEASEEDDLAGTLTLDMGVVPLDSSAIGRSEVVSPWIPGFCQLLPVIVEFWPFLLTVVRTKKKKKKQNGIEIKCGKSRGRRQSGMLSSSNACLGLWPLHGGKRQRGAQSDMLV